MPHLKQAEGAWKTHTFSEQMANIGSEVIRALNWQTKNKEFSTQAFERALELLWLTINCATTYSQRKELTRLYEIVVDYFQESNIYRTDPKKLENYFLAFTWHAQLKRNR